jgi:Tfp pilus assembly protein PilF
MVEAANAATAAIKLAPAYAEAYHTRALCHAAKGDATTAIADVYSAIEQAPHYAEAYLTLGTLYHSTHQLADAEKCFRQALSVKSDYVEAMNYLALVLQDEHRLEEAEALLRQAISLRPDYTDAPNNLGLVLRQQGKFEEAAVSFRTAYNMFEPYLVLRQPESAAGRALAVAARYVRVASDLARWSITGATRPAAWTDYRLLHQETNGRSTDLLNGLLKKVSAGGKSAPEWRSSAIFPWIGPDEPRRIADSQIATDSMSLIGQ